MWPMWWEGIKGVVILPLPALTHPQWQLFCQETINKLLFWRLVRRKKGVIQLLFLPSTCHPAELVVAFTPARKIQEAVRSLLLQFGVRADLESKAVNFF